MDNPDRRKRLTEWGRYLLGPVVLMTLLVLAACSGSNDAETTTEQILSTPTTPAESAQVATAEPTEPITPSTTNPLPTATHPPAIPSLTSEPTGTPPPTATAAPAPTDAPAPQPTIDPAGRTGSGGRFQVLDMPVMIPASQATWLDPDEIVMGVVHNGEAQAFPIGQMAYHHIANTEVGGEPYLVTY